MENKMTLKSVFDKDDVKQRFKDMLGTKAQGFITSVLQIANSNDLLKKADPISIYTAAATAATLDLPLNNSLGFAYIIPYNISTTDAQGKDCKIVVAQFQIGYKGFKQLALRTGQFLNLNSTDVREGELIKQDRLTGEIQFNWIQDQNERLSKKIVGYVSYFKLLNGFESPFYMTIEELTAHGKKYSQTFKKGFGQWKDDFNGMCLKTVTKLNLSKNAPLSIDSNNSISRAVLSDQALIKDVDTIEVEYIDNDKEESTEPTVEEKKKDLKAKGTQGKIDMP